MPKALAWYKRYPEDFRAGTVGLTLEEKGAYSICIDLIYENGGAIKDAPDWIAHVCGCSTRKWNAIRARLLELDKLIIVQGKLTNSRCETELYRSARSRDIREINGSKGGRRRAENQRRLNENNDLQIQTLKSGLSYARAYSRKEVSTFLMDEATVPSPASQEGKREEPTAPLAKVEPLATGRDRGNAEELKPTSALLSTRMMRTH